MIFFKFLNCAGISLKDFLVKHSYFSVLFLESFYNEIDKSEKNVNKLLEFWQDIFTYSTTKTRSELEAFIDLYKIFDKSLSN